MKRLKTSRLTLRTYVADDFLDLSEMLTNPEVVKLTGFRIVQTADEVRTHLEALVKFSTEGLGVWAIVHNQRSKVIGWIMLKDTGMEYPELGFMFNQSFWGQGLATEAANAVLDYGWSQLNLGGVLARCDKPNQSSQQVLKKLPMKLYKEDDSTLYFRAESQNRE